MRALPDSYLQLGPRTERSLVCFPWAGAGALPFRNWAPLVPAGLTLRAMRSGGREDRIREQPPLELGPLIAKLADDLPDEAQRPVFFGHCLGALIAFEVARELRRRGRPQPSLLVVVGEPPSLSGGDPPITDLRETLRSIGSVSESALDDPIVFSLIEPAIAADLKLTASYEYRAEPPLAFPIDVFMPTGAEPDEVERAQAWSRETTGVTRLHTIVGRNLFPGEAWQPLAASVLSAVTRADQVG
jgi:medium-chain acyl-[acyl-carrier-protein] hydrolase